MSDRASLLQLCKVAARDLKDGEFGEGVAGVVELLDRQPDLVVELLHLIVAESRKKRPDEGMMAALIFLIGRGLEFIRYRVERRLADALALSEQLRDLLLTFGRDGTLQPRALLLILGQFVHAKLEMGEPLRELMAMLADQASFEAATDGSVAAKGDPWAGAVEMTDGDPFLLFAQMYAHAGAFPAAQRAKMAVAMLQAEYAQVREAAIGWLLDEASQVRRTVADALVQVAPNGVVSGVMLRRIVSMRNWLPEGDRPRLDEAIRACRQSGIVCASWPKPTVTGIVASAFDGSGTQTLFVIVRQKRRYAVCCLLINLDAGVRDAWVQQDLSRRELDALMQEVTDQLDLYPSSSAYLTTAIAHFLGLNAAGSSLPPYVALQFAETAGFGDLNPQRTDTGELVAKLCRAADAQQASAAQAGEDEPAKLILEDAYPFLDSWFEDDDVVESLLEGSHGALHDRIPMVCDGILEARRDRWASMLAWTAFALREAGTEGRGWQNLARAARDVGTDTPLAEIAVMRSVALVTAAIHAQRQDASDTR